MDGYAPPAGVAALSSDVAAAHGGTYPYYVGWLQNGSQIGYLDLSGGQSPPTGAWLYEGTTTTAALLHGGCTVYASPSAPSPPAIAFPGCDSTTYLAIVLPGSAEWCRVQGHYFAVARSVGLAVIDWVRRAAKDGIDVANRWAAESVNSNCGLTDVFACFLDFLKGVGGQWLGQLSAMVEQATCWIANGAIRSDSCDPVTYGSLVVLYAAWNLLKNSLVGSNVWIFYQVKLGREFQIPLVDDVLVYLINASCPTEVPSPADAIAAYLSGGLNEDQFQCWLSMRGVSKDVWQPVIDARAAKLDPRQTIESVRRADLGDVTRWRPQSPLTVNEAAVESAWQHTAVARLRGLGWLSSEAAVNLYGLYDQLPSIAQHLHWLSRNIDDVTYVQRYHLLDGFSTAADVASMLGPGTPPPLPQVGERNFWATFGAELRAQGMRKVDAAREYAAHWLHGSPQQMREFAFRLRPGRLIHPWESVVSAQLGEPTAAGKPAPPSMVFTTDDFRRLLSEQDYGYRDVGWFLSTIYHVPALSYVRDMYRYGVIDETELGSYHQDLGYSTQDSERFVSVDALIKARIRMAEAHGWTPAALSDAFALGMITEDEDREWMEYQGFNDDEIDAHQNAAQFQLRQAVLRRAVSYSTSRLINQTLDAQREGIVAVQTARDALTGLGIAGDRADALLSAVSVQRLNALTRQTKTSLRRAYLRGAITRDQVVQLLSGLMADVDVVQTTVDAWNVQKLAGATPASKAEIRRYLREQLMTPDQARNQLGEIGVSKESIELMLDEVDYLDEKSRKSDEVKSEKEKDRQQQQVERAAEKAARQAEATQKSADAAAERAAKEAATVAERAAKETLRVETQAMRLAQTQARRRAADMVATARRAGQLQAKITAALKADEPPARLAKWAAQGLIDYSYYHARMNLYGYTDESIQRQWQSACAAKSAECLDGPAPGGQPGTAAEARAAATDVTGAVQSAESALSAAEQQQQQVEEQPPAGGAAG